jgi:peptidoglycan L-alanyl-D-glutamate endopeptidase CwlK
MSSRNLADAHIILQNRFTYAKQEFEKANKGVEVKLSCTYRSNAEQNALYALGRTIKGAKVTNAKAGQSPHNYQPSFAIDVFFTVNGVVDWSPKWFTAFSKFMKTTGISWGGDFKSIPDSPHYELSNWKTLAK